MSSGIRLNSQEDFENAGSKMNILFVVAVVAGFILGTMAGDGMLMLIVIFLIAAWCIKGEYLKWKIRDFRIMEFWKPENLTVEEIKEKASESLSKHDIEICLEDGELVFKHGSILYEYKNVAEGVFSLRWGYTLAKAFFSYSYIKNYNTVREDMGYIVYTIQTLV